MMTNPAVDRHLVELVESMTSWALAEANLAHDLGRPDVYLGGDGLRPYVTWSDDGVVRVAGRQPPHLPAPKLVDELIAGSHGLASVTRDPDRPESYALTLPRVASLTNRLDVPELLLVGLGDAERYRGARLALGIARLGQWLRFTHAARVTIVDYNLLAQPVATLADLLSKRRFDIVGVSFINVKQIN